MSFHTSNYIVSRISYLLFQNIVSRILFRKFYHKIEVSCFFFCVRYRKYFFLQCSLLICTSLQHSLSFETSNTCLEINCKVFLLLLLSTGKILREYEARSFRLFTVAKLETWKYSRQNYLLRLIIHILLLVLSCMELNNVG